MENQTIEITLEEYKMLRDMLEDSSATSLDLSSFDTSNVTSMRYMFFKLILLKHIIII